MLVIELMAYLAIGALSGVLAGLFGVGGGAIMVPALMLLFGALGLGGDWMAHLAVGTSLATIIGTGAASTLAHHRRGGVRWDIVWPLAPGIVIGALAGAALAGWIPGLWLQRIFAVFLAYVGVRLLLTPAASVSASHPLPGRAGLAGVGGGIGMLSSLVGIGGGTLTVPFLGRHGLEMRQAVGTSAACGLPIALAGALGFVLTGWGRAGLPAFSTGFVYWPAVLAMLIASMPIAPLGARLAHALPVDLLKRLFGGLLLLIAMRLAFS
ncbi:sulfite exporter TauE/SafE family protein [Allochromatium palmeri]|uniref:Probable membrane transporter protein n=1 Tax=Allochromatium palmeri TaxID=231048 RepID=A0A6N8E7C5_9GAMM|nr:sulfite exporter TauE/SafE family protein [Allochromatium palmeri]MTW20152.1 TSUP family transporter [Allochromatium palmeri]